MRTPLPKLGAPRFCTPRKSEDYPIEERSSRPRSTAAPLRGAWSFESHTNLTAVSRYVKPIVCRWAHFRVLGGVACCAYTVSLGSVQHSRGVDQYSAPGG